MSGRQHFLRTTAYDENADLSANDKVSDIKRLFSNDPKFREDYSYNKYVQDIVISLDATKQYGDMNFYSSRVEVSLKRLEDGTMTADYIILPDDHVISDNVCLTLLINQFEPTQQMISDAQRHYTSFIERLRTTIYLTRNNRIAAIILEDNEIGDEDVVALSEALRGNTSVQKIYLTNNQIGDAGVAALASSLHGNTSIQWIYLDRNQIGDAGATALAEALRGNTSIELIDLGGNQIGDAGALALAGALRVNTYIQEIYLKNNRIGGDGAAELMEALKNHTIPLINLDGNQIGGRRSD